SSKGTERSADMGNISEPDRRVVAAGREEEPRDAPMGGGGEEADQDGDGADDGGGMEYSLHRLPQQQCANEHESDRVEHIGRAQQVPRDSVRLDERQIEENERHLVGEIVHAIHDEAQTVGLESGDRFHHENRGVERGGCGERLAIMGHGTCSSGAAARRIVPVSAHRFSASISVDAVGPTSMAMVVTLSKPSKRGACRLPDSLSRSDPASTSSACRTWRPTKYNNKHRAIHAMEKGTPGQRVFADAFEAWKQ